MSMDQNEPPYDTEPLVTRVVQRHEIIRMFKELPDEFKEIASNGEPDDWFKLRVWRLLSNEAAAMGGDNIES